MDGEVRRQTVSRFRRSHFRHALGLVEKSASLGLHGQKRWQGHTEWYGGAVPRRQETHGNRDLQGRTGKKGEERGRVRQGVKRSPTDQKRRAWRAFFLLKRAFL